MDVDKDSFEVGAELLELLRLDAGSEIPANEEYVVEIEVVAVEDDEPPGDDCLEFR
ncbi:MAG: hypothetical protein ACTSU5_21715 [Promethearchaeota archaeon]